MLIFSMRSEERLRRAQRLLVVLELLEFLGIQVRCACVLFPGPLESLQCLAGNVLR